jgi:hypothetical protein
MLEAACKNNKHLTQALVTDRAIHKHLTQALVTDRAIHKHHTQALVTDRAIHCFIEIKYLL